MSNIKKITKKYVESLKSQDGKEIFIWDTELKGFGVRIWPSGKKTYLVQYRNEFNRTRRRKIGTHGSITTEQARDQAKIILGSIAKGEDPSAEHRNKRLERKISELCSAYLELHAKPHKNVVSYIEDERRINNVILPRFGMMKLSELKSVDLQALHNEFSVLPYKANRLLSLLTKMFNLAIQWEWIDSNPTRGISPYKEQPRTRWLNEQELSRLWKVLNLYETQSISNIIKLLLLTGARSHEVLKATWDQFDLDKAVWTKPSHTTKQQKMEHCPLSLSALNIIKKLNEVKADSVHLFPGKIPGKPLQTIKKSWATIRNRANLSDVRLHDLRHTYASHLVSSGLSLSIVGKLLGHTQASTTQRYAHLADEPLRDATTVFGDKLEALTKAF